MIGNKYLQSLFEYPDEDTSLNQLLEMLKYKDDEFINSLKDPVNLELCTGINILNEGIKPYRLLLTVTFYKCA